MLRRSGQLLWVGLIVLGLNTAGTPQPSQAQQLTGRPGVDRPLTQAESYAALALKLATQQHPDYDSAIINYSRALKALEEGELEDPCTMGFAQAGLKAARAAKYSAADFRAVYDIEIKSIPDGCFV